MTPDIIDLHTSNRVSGQNRVPSTCLQPIETRPPICCPLLVSATLSDIVHHERLVSSHRHARL
jgi:hypothetical protein